MSISANRYKAVNSNKTVTKPIHGL